MNKKRILLIVPIRFSVRSFLQTEIYERLLEYSDILILSPYADSDTFRTKFTHPSVSHALLDDFQFTGRYAIFHGLRVNASRRQRRLKCLSVRYKIGQYNYKKNHLGLYQTLKRYARVDALPAIFSCSAGIKALRRMEEYWYKKENYSHQRRYQDLLASFSPDLVISTSPNRPQEIPIARATFEMGIPHVAYILSFDNIVCYEEYPRLYDKYYVWNERNRDELLRTYPSIKREAIEITGPIQFDFYANRGKYAWSREEWARRNKLDANSKVVLYAETGHAIGPHEPEIVEDLCLQLRTWHSDARPQVLVRLHPMYTDERWEAVRYHFPEVRFQAPNQPRGQKSSLAFQDHVDWDYEDLAQLISTLQHSDVHINLSSTMALDAAYFDRPVIGIAYDPRPGKPYDAIAKDLYYREHFIDITHSGGISIAFSTADTLKYIQRYLENPRQDSEARHRMLRSYDPFLDGRAASRVAEAIIGILSNAE